MKYLIDKQAALDALNNSRFPGAPYADAGISIAIGVICDLPPAQPECQWIPCSERLPEHGGRYLISVIDGINRRTTVVPYLPRCKAWTMTGRMAYWKVIAWMPLPEPYEERR